jgi:group I intron endonuclease
MAVIYRITNMANSHFYIGSADSFARREWQHKYDLRRGVHKNPRLQAAWNKYGEEMFVFEILEEVPEGESQLAWENKYLHVHVGRPDCYNINRDAELSRLGLQHTEESKRLIGERVRAAVAEGKAGAFIPSAETRSKMSEALKGNKNALGYKRTDAEKEAIRQRTLGNKIWLGKKHTEESKLKMSKAIYAVLPDGGRQDFDSITDARLKLEVHPPTLDRALKSGKPLAKGRLKGWTFYYVVVDSPPAAC